MITKSALRIIQKNKRKQLDVQNLSREIIQNLFEIKEFKAANSVFSYISFGSEINTNSILNISDKNIYVPKISNDNMLMCKYQPTELIPNKYGILEPKNCKEFFPQQNDIIIVPALAADKNFNRLGYGGGYYDKFLKNTNSIKIILLAEALFVPKIPIEKHDVSVDIIVTECTIYRK